MGQRHQSACLSFGRQFGRVFRSQDSFRCALRFRTGKCRRLSRVAEQSPEQGAARYGELYALFPLSDGFEAGGHFGQQMYVDALATGTAGYACRRLEIDKRAGPWRFGFAYHVLGVPGDVCYGERLCSEIATFSLACDFSF